MNRIFFIIIFFLSCNAQKEVNKSLLNVGDIPFDKLIDDDKFSPCNETFIGQYFFASDQTNVTSIKSEIDNFFYKNYINQNIRGETGLVRIRFIINCKGIAGRFRVLSADTAYKNKTFDKKITSQLLSLVKQIDFWKIAKTDKSSFDYYYYLIFKIENGNLKEILP